MNFFRESYKYTFKNIIKLMVFLLPVSILMGLINPFKTISFLWNLKSTTISSYADFLKGSFSINWVYLVGVIVAGILLVISVSVALSGVDYHMRTGKFSFVNSFKRMNYFLVPVTTLFIIFVVFSAVILFLMPAICYFIHYFVAGNGAIPTRFSYTITLLIYLVGNLVIFMFLAVVLNAINLVSLSGYNVKSALSNSLSLLEGKFVKFMGAIMSPFIVIIPITILCDGLKLFPIIAIVLFALFLSYIVSLSLTTYFEFTKIPRKDNKPAGYFGSRGE